MRVPPKLLDNWLEIIDKNKPTQRHAYKMIKQFYGNVESARHEQERLESEQESDEF